MARILHLLDVDADFQTRRAVSNLTEKHLKAPFVARHFRIGRGGDEAGVVGAISRLRRMQHDAPDLVHAWGQRALTSAALGWRGPILYTPETFPDTRAVRWIRAVMSYRAIQIVCPSATMRRRLIERGVPGERCHLIRPGVDFSQVRRRRDDSLRDALGLNPQDIVLLACGESTRAADHERAVWTAAILHVLDERYKLLIWGRGERAAAAASFARKLRRHDLLRVAELKLARPIEFEQLIPASDVVLISATGPVATLPVCTCMAAGLPIISTVTYTLGELLEDRHNALMVPHPTPRLLAQRVLDVRNDTGLQWRISDMARTEAYEYFSLTRFVQQHRTAYEQLASGEPVQIAEPAPGAGLRFHGRG